MSIVTEKYTRKPFPIEAIKVTDENMEDVAKWCGGEIHTQNDKRFIKVDVNRPLTEKQTKAFVGDWVLKARQKVSNSGFKVYTEKAFVHCFDRDEEALETVGQEALFDKPAPKIHVPANYPEPSTR